MWNNTEVMTPSTVQANMMSKYFYHRGRVWPQLYDYFVVIDFEATCENTRNELPRPIRHERPEIIQFPAVLVDTWTMQKVDTFNSLVRPLETPVLSEFCTNLTGITQSMVEKAPTFPEVLHNFECWLRKYGIAVNSQERGHSFAFVTDGSYDMGHFLYKQCIISQTPFPSYASRWVNIRTLFTKVYSRRWVCLKVVLDLIGLPFEGRAHNGMDDAQNICNILLHLLYMLHLYAVGDDCIVHQTEKILLEAADQEKNAARILSDKSAGKYDLATVEPMSLEEYLLFNFLYEYQPKMYYPARCSNESSAVISNLDYCNSSQRAATTGSCESIASGCSNKENSIPIYIPNKLTTTTTGIKNRASTGSKDTSASNGVSSNGTGSGRHAGKRKKRNLQLKDPGSNTSASVTCLKNAGVSSKVGTDSITNDVTRHSYHLKQKNLDADGSSTSHLQPLVSDLPNEE